MSLPETAGQDKRPLPNRRLNVLRLLALVAVVAISVYIYSIRDQAEQLAGYGYAGIFIVSFMAYATVLLPAPGIWLVFTMGAVFPPAGVALAAGAGAALGEAFGYMAGFSGQAMIERAAIYNRLTRWMRKNGPLTVYFLAAIPNPFFDLAGLIAGALKMNLATFMLWVWLGETTKMFLFAYAGSSLQRLL